MPNRAASRAPARPASATAIAASIRRSNEVRRALGAVSAAGCSAKVRAAHAGVVAEEPPYPQPQPYRPAGDRGIGQLAAIPAVHPPRRLPAPRARRLVDA